jgi:hypothetical protein
VLRGAPALAVQALAGGGAHMPTSFALELEPVIWCSCSRKLENDRARTFWSWLRAVRFL